jgi:indolepyruvate ferredoxin oxidoreductase
VRSREYLDEVQRHLRTVEGCTAIIYDQTCAAEKRRRRKRGIMEDPKKRVFINPLVCEGCGDCSVQSNCISVEPLETEFGRKRQINQSSCNKDFSCVNGFCPSFVTIEGGDVKKAALPKLPDAPLPDPAVLPLGEVYNIAITGVGGTGVLTIGAIIGMAAHLEGKAAMIQDFSGLAQKGGAVLSHVRLARQPGMVASAQIVTGEADLLIAADTVVAAAKDSIALYGLGRTRAVLNTHLAPVSNFVFNRDFDFRERDVIGTIEKFMETPSHRLDFGALAEAVCGDTIATNIMMLGYASQKGLLPVGQAALLRAIELNAVSVNANKLAFAWGRRFAQYPQEADAVLKAAHPQAPAPKTLEELVQHRAEFLTAYQDKPWADRYRALVARAEAAEARLGEQRSFTEAVARFGFKLMAYKDEYEVARLYVDGDFERRIRETFEGDYKLNFHLAPPVFQGELLPNGRPRKRRFGPWMMPAFRVLAKLKRLRGTAFDPFGRSAERRTERRIIAEYEAMVSEIAERLTSGNHDLAVALARIPDMIRGFGPVKEAAVQKAEAEKAALLAKFRAPAPEPLRQAAE